MECCQGQKWEIACARSLLTRRPPARPSQLAERQLEHHAASLDIRLREPGRSSENPKNERLDNIRLGLDIQGLK